MQVFKLNGWIVVRHEDDSATVYYPDPDDNGGLAVSRKCEKFTCPRGEENANPNCATVWCKYYCP